jgi:hypothetical protein
MPLIGSAAAGQLALIEVVVRCQSISAAVPSLTDAGATGAVVSTVMPFEQLAGDELRLLSIATTQRKYWLPLASVRPPRVTDSAVAFVVHVAIAPPPQSTPPGRVEMQYS